MPPSNPAPSADATEASADDVPAEPLTEPIAAVSSEDVQSIDSSAVAPVDDASDLSAKLASDERMKKPVPASSFVSGQRARTDTGVRMDPVASPMVRRSAPAVGLHPPPRRRGLRWVWVFLPAVLLVAVLAALYVLRVPDQRERARAAAARGHPLIRARARSSR